MTGGTRRALFAVSAVGTAALFAWASLGLPTFGTLPGAPRTSDVMAQLAPTACRVQNVVTAIVFDLRALDTLGEEMILFACVTAVLLLLRNEPSDEERPSSDERRRFAPVPPRSDAVAGVSLPWLSLVILFGIYLAVHAHLTPGGGFQGGAILATSWLLAFVAFGHRAARRLFPTGALEVVEALAAAVFVAFGLGTLLFTGTFLRNALPLGTYGELLSGGSVFVLGIAVAIEVGAGLALAFEVFLAERHRGGDPGA